MQEIINNCFSPKIKPECKGCMFLVYLIDSRQEKPCDIIKCKNR